MNITIVYFRKHLITLYLQTFNHVHFKSLSNTFFSPQFKDYYTFSKWQLFSLLSIKINENLQKTKTVHTKWTCLYFFLFCYYYLLFIYTREKKTSSSLLSECMFLFNWFCMCDEMSHWLSEWMRYVFSFVLLLLLLLFVIDISVKIFLRKNSSIVLVLLRFRKRQNNNPRVRSYDRNGLTVNAFFSVWKYEFIPPFILNHILFRRIFKVFF